MRLGRLLFLIVIGSVPIWAGDVPAGSFRATDRPVRILAGAHLEEPAKEILVSASLGFGI